MVRLVRHRHTKGPETDRAPTPPRHISTPPSEVLLHISDYDLLLLGMWNWDRWGFTSEFARNPCSIDSKLRDISAGENYCAAGRLPHAVHMIGDGIMKSGSSSLAMSCCNSPSVTSPLATNTS
jgi:hypothetical protein